MRTKLKSKPWYVRAETGFRKLVRQIPTGESVQLEFAQVSETNQQAADKTLLVESDRFAGWSTQAGHR